MPWGDENVSIEVPAAATTPTPAVAIDVVAAVLAVWDIFWVVVFVLFVVLLVVLLVVLVVVLFVVLVSEVVVIKVQAKLLSVQLNAKEKN